MRMLSRKPVATLRYDYSGGTVATSGWTEVLSALTQPASAIEIFNQSASMVRLSTGAAGDEAAHEVPYSVLPGGSSILLPLEFAKGKRLAARAVGADITLGFLVINFFA